jgi:yeast amino acid transporter
MAAAEVKRPRVYVKTAFKTVYWRFGLFFILGALCVGIVVPYNDPQLQGVFLGTAGGGGTAAASPYVIAMSNLGISTLPSVVNALLITSIFSAGNTYTFCATRSLYSMALEGHAPKIFRKTTRNGVPLYAFAVVMAFPFLSFLQVSDNSSVVITWLVSLITAGALINYFVIALTYLNFHKACQVQGLDRKTLPYYAWFQPGCAYVVIVVEIVICIFYGYGAFQPWSVESFFQNYTMQILAPIMYIGWKLVKRTKKLKPSEVDLVWERPIVDAYEESFLSPPSGFWLEMGQLIGIKRHIKDDERRGSIQRRGSTINPFK